MRRSIMILACLLSGCSSYNEVSWGNGVAWEQARTLSQENIRRLANAVANGHQSKTGKPAPATALSSLQRTQPKTIPPSNRHVVMPGENLIRIAQRYGTSLERLASLNGLQRPYTIYTGQEIWLKPRPDVPQTYRVASGDTFLGIAYDFGLSFDDIRRQNPGVDPERLRVGQSLNLARTVTTHEQTKTQVAQLQKATNAPVPQRSQSGFLWPVQGQIVESFGPKPNGMRNDGINISAAKGATVRAAEAGIVVYAGEAVHAMGRMLMIRHADNYVTAYGHNQALLVTVGDRVERGQPIARVGNTGTVKQAQLHFQIRKGKEPIDPAKLLSPGNTRIASRTN